MDNSIYKGEDVCEVCGDVAVKEEDGFLVCEEHSFLIPPSDGIIALRKQFERRRNMSRIPYIEGNHQYLVTAHTTKACKQSNRGKVTLDWLKNDEDDYTIAGGQLSVSPEMAIKLAIELLEKAEEVLYGEQACITKSPAKFTGWIPEIGRQLWDHFGEVQSITVTVAGDTPNKSRTFIYDKNLMYHIVEEGGD